MAAALLAGCSFIPTYERPAAPVPQAYALAGADVPATARAAADIDWKEYFSDPRLQRLIGVALGNNRDLRVAMLNVEQARAQFQIQRAGQYPTVNAIASGTRQPSTATGEYTNLFQVGLGITAWEIDFFGRIAALKEQALAQYLATEEARKSAQISLVAAVASGWLTLMADEELLDISRRTLATREESVKLTRLRLENGVSSELDNSQALSLAQAARASACWTRTPWSCCWARRCPTTSAPACLRRAWPRPCPYSRCPRACPRTCWCAARTSAWPSSS
jgi:multidrug efflux system outer membrane protein